jgi:hypothetical protein
MEWRLIEDNYFCNNLGVVRNGSKILKNSIDIQTGYGRTFINGKIIKTHKIIAMCFLPNPNNYGEIDHINGIRSDNRVENLRWTTRSENSKNRQSYSNTGYKFISKINNSYQIQIGKTNFNGLPKFKKQFKTLNEAIIKRNEIIQQHNINWREDYDNPL